MNRRAVIAALLVAAAGSARAEPNHDIAPGTAPLCVTNASAERYYFTVRTVDPGERVGRELAPGETLCLDRNGRGVVAAFETADSLEGCSRLVPAGGRETLSVFGRFDRCAWGDPDG